MNILQRIFTDHYEEIIYTLHPRKTEVDNIDKMLGCGDPSFGGAMYHCPNCGNFKFVPFRCHSRFCPTCGNKYSMERTTSMSFKLVSVPHRHCVFTIDENLRDFFPSEPLPPGLPLSFRFQCNFKNVFQPEPYQKLHSRLYHGPSYIRQGSQMESSCSLPSFRRRLQ